MNAAYANISSGEVSTERLFFAAIKAIAEARRTWHGAGHEEKRWESIALSIAAMSLALCW
jgi:hypothetical protein